MPILICQHFTFYKYIIKYQHHAFSQNTRLSDMHRFEHILEEYIYIRHISFLQMEALTNSSVSAINRTLVETVTQRSRATFEIDEEFYNIYVRVVNVILTPIVCILGLSGNGLGLFVLWNDSKYHKQSIYRYMLALMAFDNAFLCVSLFLSMITIIRMYDWFLANAISIHMLYVTASLDMIIYHTTSALLVVMSLERLNALLRPLNVKQMWLNRFPRRIIAAIVILIITFVLPFPIGVEIITRPKDNRTSYYFQSRPNFFAFHIMLSTVETVISCFYPVLMLIFNMSIPIAYCRYLQKRRDNLPDISTSDTQQRRITLMVLWVTGLYMLLAIPKVFLQIIIFFVDIEYDHGGKYSRTFYFFSITGNFFARISSANDFLVYVLVSERYRKLISIIFARCWSKSDEYKQLSDIFRFASHNVSRAKSTKQPIGAHISVIDGSDSLQKTD